MSNADATHPTGDEREVCDYAFFQARNAAKDGEGLFATHDYHEAALRLLEASNLYRIAAHQLELQIRPADEIPTATRTATHPA